MTLYSTIADSEIDPESPGTTTLFTKLRDNPIAITEKAAGAPVLADNYIVSAMITDGAVTIPKLPTYTVGDYLEGNIAFRSATSLGDMGASYAKQLEIIIARSGTVRVRLGIREDSAAWNIVGKIYVNGSPQGTERAPTTTTNWQWWNEDIAVTAGDLVQIYAHRGGSTSERGSIACAILCSNPIASGLLYTLHEALSRTDSTPSIYD